MMPIHGSLGPENRCTSVNLFVEHFQHVLCTTTSSNRSTCSTAAMTAVPVTATGSSFHQISGQAEDICKHLPHFLNSGHRPACVDGVGKERRCTSDWSKHKHVCAMRKLVSVIQPGNGNQLRKSPDYRNDLRKSFLNKHPISASGTRMTCLIE